MKLVALQAVSPGEEGINSLLGIATEVFASEALPVHGGEALPPGRLCAMQLTGGDEFRLALPEAGHWVIFLEHAPGEFGLHAHGFTATAVAEFGSHHHEAEIGSIGIADERALDPAKVNDWLSYLLQSRGADILRMKGVLNIQGEARRYVFHGVHMIFDGRPERAWGDDPRINRLVFIGRNLDRQELEAGFESCVAS